MSFQIEIKNNSGWKVEVEETADYLQGTAATGGARAQARARARSALARAHAAPRRTGLNTPVIDAHPGWCGPCKAIFNTFKKVFFDLSDKPLKFYTADTDKINALEQYKGSDRPVFLFYKNGEKINEVVGCNPPKLISLIESELGIEG